MIAFILAAGFGTRLKPLTNYLPKALVPVCGISLLERNLALFSSFGIQKLVVNTHYLHKQIEIFQKKSHFPFTLFHEKDRIRGTGGALFFARKFLCNDEIFCVANSDIVSTADIEKLTVQFLKSNCICALVAAPAKKHGTIYLDCYSKEYKGTISEKSENSPYMPVDFIGIALYRKEILNYITEEDFSVLPVWKRVQKNNHSVKVIVDDTILWKDTGTLSELAQIHFDVIDRKIQLPVPENIYVDFDKKIAFPRGTFFSAFDNIGEYSWVESDKLSDKTKIKNSIVFSGVEMKQEGLVEKKIVTKWGEIAFG